MHKSVFVKNLVGGVISLILVFSTIVSCSKTEVLRDPAAENEVGQALPEGDASEEGSQESSEGREPASDNPSQGLSEDGGEIELKQVDTLDLTGRDSEKELLYFFAAIDDDGKDASDSGDSKVTVTVPSSGQGTSVWENGDEIKVYDNSGNSALYQYTVAGRFSVKKDSEPLATGKTYYAFYPASMCTGFSNGTATFDFANITGSQYFYGSGNADGSFTISRANSEPPMACCFTGNGKTPATFKNIGELLMVQVYGDEKVKSVAVNCSGTILNGTGTISLSGVGAIPSMSMASGSATSTVTVPEGGSAQLSRTLPVNFFFILPPGQNCSNMEFKTTFVQTDGTTTFTPTMTRRGNLGTTSRGKVRRVRLNAHYFSGGTGTSTNPYRISSIKDLQALYQFSGVAGKADTSGFVDGHRNYFVSNKTYYQQTTDLNLSGISNVAPLGSVTYPVSFNYDGNSKNINNLTAVGESSINMALFGKIIGGSVKNLNLNNPVVAYTGTNASSNTAALVGYLDGGSVQNCTVSGAGAQIGYSGSAVSPKAAGIIGYMTNGATATDCYLYDGSTVKAAGLSSGSGGSSVYYCAGVVGEANGCTLTRCEVGETKGGGKGAMCSIIATTANVGAVAGVCGKFTGNGKICDSPYFTRTTLTSAGDNVGGIIGILGEGSKIQCPNKATVSCANDTDPEYKLVIRGRNNVGGLVGDCAGTIENQPLTVSGTTAEIPKAMNFRASVIGTGEKVGGVVGNLAATGKVYRPRYDGYDAWNSEVTGHNYTGGLVGYCASGSYVEDVQISKVKISGKDNTEWYDCVGGIAGYSAGTTGISEEVNKASTVPTPISNCTVEGENRVGGQFGELAGTHTNKDGKVCVNFVDVTAHGSYAGGAVGYMAAGSKILRATVSGKYDSDTKILTATKVRAYVSHAGGVAGYCAGEIGNMRACFLKIYVEGESGTVSGCDYAGGIAGEMVSGSSYTSPSSQYAGVSGCTICAWEYAGGITGKLAGTVTGRYNAEKTGSNDDGDTYRTVANKYTNDGSSKITGYQVQTVIEAKQGFAGGIAGRNDGGTITNCKVGCWTDQFDSTSHLLVTAKGCAGGICGDMTSGTISETMVDNVDVVATGTDIDDSNSGGFVGHFSGGIVTGRTKSFTVRNVKVDAKKKNIGGLVGQMTGGSVGSSGAVCKVQASVSTPTDYAGGIAGCYAGGTLSYCNVYDGTSVEFLGGGGGIVGGMTENCTLSHCNAEDVKLTTSQPASSGADMGAVVGAIRNDGTVSYCTSTNCEFDAKNNSNCFGGIVGRVNKGGTVSNCTTSGLVNKKTSGNMIGGVVGLADNALTVENCAVSDCATLQMNLSSGGVVGCVAGNLTASGCSVSDCTVTADSNYAGGIVGEAQAGMTISGCSVSNCTITADSNYAGGIVGEAKAGMTISGCTVSGGSVTAGASYSGGIVGEVGNTSNKTISGCRTIGLTITSTGNNAGGIAGRILGPGTIDRCFSNSNATAQSAVGGIVGRTSTENSLYITNCITANNEYTATATSGARAIGGIVGVNTNTTKNLYILNCWAAPKKVSATGFADGSGGILGWADDAVTMVNCVSLWYWEMVYIDGKQKSSQASNTGTIIGHNTAAKEADYILSWGVQRPSGTTLPYTNFTNYSGDLSNEFSTFGYSGSTEPGTIQYYSSGTTKVTDKKITDFVAAGVTAAQAKAPTGVTIAAWSKTNSSGKYPDVQGTGGGKDGIYFIVPKDVAPDKN